MDKNTSYESALARLNEIVETLEEGKCGLDESLKLFQEGTKLSAYCYKKLETAKQKITNVSEKKD